MTSKQKTVIEIISRVVEAWTEGQGDPRPFMMIALRESRLNPSAAGDISNGTAAKAWKREKPRFVRAKNPFVGNDAAWNQSIGLYQLMPANHLDRWDIRANPLILFDPVITTITAGRFLNRAIALGAKTLVDTRMIWAYGPKGIRIPKNDPRYLERVQKERVWAQELGYPLDISLWPIARFKLGAFGDGPQPGQEERAAAIRGETGVKPIPDKKSPILGLILFGLVMFGLS